MKKLLALLVLIISIFTLAACGESDVPDDMQLAGGSDELGYYFYAPDGWVCSTTNNITTAYVSKVNNTSVSFTRIDENSFGAVGAGGCGIEDCRGASLDDKAHFFLYHYFDSTKGDFPSSLSVKEAKSVLLGKEGETADNARSYEFSYKYKNMINATDAEEVGCSFIQYFIAHGDRYYILTYSAVSDVPKGLETSSFDRYLEKLDMVIKNFRFLDSHSEESEEGAAEYERDEDGYLLVAEKSHTGFDFYAHEDFSNIVSSGYVSVTHADGSNVTMTKASATGITLRDYLLRRREELILIGATDFEFLTDMSAEGQENGIPSRLGNIPEGEENTSFNYAFEYEYKYTYQGIEYRVYQVLAVSGNAFSADAYVFTYTAADTSFESHIEAVYTMRDKVYIK